VELEFQISDTGVGIDSRYIGKILIPSVKLTTPFSGNMADQVLDCKSQGSWWK
jgi:hypothetical protein